MLTVEQSRCMYTLCIYIYTHTHIGQQSSQMNTFLHLYYLNEHVIQSITLHFHLLRIMLMLINKTGFIFSFLVFCFSRTALRAFTFTFRRVKNENKKKIQFLFINLQTNKRIGKSKQQVVVFTVFHFLFLHLFILFIILYSVPAFFLPAHTWH